MLSVDRLFTQELQFLHISNICWGGEAGQPSLRRSWQWACLVFRKHCCNASFVSIRQLSSRMKRKIPLISTCMNIWCITIAALHSPTLPCLFILVGKGHLVPDGFFSVDDILPLFCWGGSCCSGLVFNAKWRVMQQTPVSGRPQTSRTPVWCPAQLHVNTTLLLLHYVSVASTSCPVKGLTMDGRLQPRVKHLQVEKGRIIHWMDVLDCSCALNTDSPLRRGMG